MKSMLNSKAFQGLAVAAASVATAFGLAAKSAVEFEDKMADVLKVMDDMSKSEVKRLKQEIIDLGQILPIPIQGIADIYAAAGSAGEAREEMRQFALDVGHVATAFDISADEAGRSMGKMKAALELSQDEVRLLFDAINELGNSITGTSRDVINFMNRAAGAGKALGLTGEQTAALGAAMIDTGTESRVAASSLRALTGALLAGSSMTEKQISALSRLGYAQEDAGRMEILLTSEVQRQSARRVELAQNETDQISKEISRRYRDQLTFIRDRFDDEADLAEKKLRERTQKEIKAIQTRMQQEIESYNARTKAGSTSSDRQIEISRKRYETQIEDLRDNLEKELKLLRRSNRDKMTSITDQLQDQEDLELKAQEKRLKAILAKEDENKKIELANARAKARDLAASFGKNFAEQIRANSLEGIKDLFERIRNLPEAEQYGVFKDLAGETTARGFVNLINASETFASVLAIVSKEQNFANSTFEEFARASATTAAEIQKFKNEISALYIQFGTAMLPVMKGFMDVLGPVVNAFTWANKELPGFTFGVLALGGALVTLTLALPAIASLVFLLGNLGAIKFAGLTAAIKGIIAGITGLGPAITAAIAPAMKGVVAAILGVKVAFLAIPLAVAAVGLVIWKFKDQIGAAFQQIGEILFAPFKAWWDLQVTTWTNFINLVKGVWSQFTSIVKTAIAVAKAPMLAFINLITRAIRLVSRLNFFRKKSKGSSKAKEFAEGGFVTGPTLAYVGEGGSPEYVVPSHKAEAFANNYLSGLRGAAAIPRFAQGGVIMPGNANVSIQTGPVTQMNGQNFVTTQDMSRAVQSGVNQTLSLLRGDMNIRRQVGLT